ncbi:LysR substrate-binding domain-containing protein [Aliamphritea hakodatensis]|uniref:LysR substrate-binding domain-containing protein n=1 Tax=Aliamphritea hakodatensis TaxID=2895352 RepID=UPI0022FDA414|nr:LysR family transcriptional regulator [Aliamphritea hakodatensis]
MLPLLDLDLLRTFAAVVQAGEFKKAAETVHRSHAAVSMQIKRLEEQLGCQLMQRNNQGIRLTESGEILMGYCEQFLKLNAATFGALAETPLAGKVRFGIPTDYAQDFLQDFLPVLAAEMPNLDARIVCDRSRNLRQMLAAGQLDIAIVAGEEEYRDEQLIWTERLQWCGSYGQQRTDATPLPFALLEENCIVRDLALQQLQAGQIPYERVFSSTVLENIAAAVAAGFAVSLLPESSARAGNIKPLEDPRLDNNQLLKMNMICSQAIDPRISQRLTERLREAASRILRKTAG